ncbi:MAG: hypothetical protein ABR510_05900 [Trueperaceae bacterium]
MSATRRRVRTTVRLALVVVATVVLAAVAWPRDGGNPFRAYAASTLTPGVGLSELQLGTTTLGGFLERFGAGRPALAFGDETAVELAFARAGAVFTYVVDGACADAVQRGHREVFRALVSGRSFVSSYPACADEPLDTLALRLVAGRTFWRGATDLGVRLGQPRNVALAALGAPPASDAEEPTPESWFDPSGLVVRFGTDPGDRTRWQVVELVVVAP